MSKKFFEIKYEVAPTSCKDIHENRIFGRRFGLSDIGDWTIHKNFYIRGHLIKRVQENSRTYFTDKSHAERYAKEENDKMEINKMTILKTIFAESVY